MKKLFYLFFLLPFSLLMACNDDNDLPQVDLTLTLSGVTLVNDNFYTVSGEDIIVEGLSVKSLNGKPSTVANVGYFFDDQLLVGEQPPQPFMGTFSTEGIPAGDHSFGVAGNILQEGSPISNFGIAFKFVIVETEEDLPAGAPEIGEYSVTVTLNPGK